MRAVHLLLLLGMACGNALAQTPPPSPAPAAAGAQREALPDPEPLSGRSNQRTERIQIEDAGSRVDELRVGGQTQSIEVKPSNDKLRPYQVQPEKADAGISDKSTPKGLTNRSWKLFNF